MTTPTTMKTLTDDQLATATAHAKAHEDQAVATLIAYLCEVRARRLHLKLGFASLTRYLVDGLGLSSDAAGIRTRVVGVVQRYPRILEMLATADLHLTSVCVLASHLEPASADALLDDVRGKSRREIEVLLADRSPKPDVPTSIRRLPTPHDPTIHPEPDLFKAPTSPDTDRERHSGSAPGRIRERSAHAGRQPTPRPTSERPSAPSTHRAATPRPRRRARPPKPLGRDRYKVTFTASRRLVAKLDRLQALLSGQVPANDVAGALEKALDVAIEAIEKRRFGARRTSKPKRRAPSPAATVTEEAPGRSPSPRTTQPHPPRPRSRYIPKPVRRAVYERDEGTCTYVSTTGRRCGARHHLQLEHRKPFALGGAHTVENLTLRCRAHNLLAAVEQLGDIGAHVGRGWR